MMNTTTIVDKLKLDMPLTDFIRGVNKKLNDHWHNAGLTYNDPPLVMVEKVGPKYAKLAVYEKQPHKTGPLVANRVYCFYDHTNGDLLKGTWKAPVAKGVRGNVNDFSVLDKFDWHGPKYLR
jgi:hypothetical protein